MIYGGLFDLDNKIKRKEEINKIINDVSFWSTSSKDDVLKEYNSLSNTIDKIKIITGTSDNKHTFTLKAKDINEDNLYESNTLKLSIAPISYIASYS